MTFNVMDFFRNAAQAPNGQTPVQAATPPNPQVQQAAAAQAGAPQAFAGTPAAAPQVNESPLDQFAKAFDTKPDPNAPAAPSLDSPLFNMDQAKLAEAAGKMDFTKHLNPELAQKALQGDPAALLSLMNSFGQALTAQNVQLAARVTEQGVNSRVATLQELLPQQVRSLQVADTLSGTPELNHAAIRPVVQGLTKQFMTAYPNHSPAQITELVQSYFQEVAKTVAPRQEPTAQTTHSKGEFVFPM